MQKRGAYCTDVHFGKRGNSDQHNQDCINFLTWFCEQVRKDGKIDYIGVLGDWNENRTAINLDTLSYSYQGAKLLNDLGLPVYFCVGNHDCLHRNSRDIHSIIPFTEFSNFFIIDKPTIISDIENKALFCPYMFHEEYPELVQYDNIPMWAGHFEFKGFRMTGTGTIRPTGPDSALFKGPKHILSGHYHKRQILNNVVYMGNIFPMDFSDAGDNERGMLIYNNSKHTYNFIDWPDCPKFIKVKLSTLLDESTELPKQSRVICVADIPLTYEESVLIRQKYLKENELREFSLEEGYGEEEALTDTEVDIDVDNIRLDSIEELVVQMLNSVELESIDNDILIEQYKSLQI